MSAPAQPAVWLPDDLRAEMLVYAREAKPDEACGILIGVATETGYRIEALKPALNLHPSSEDRYLIDPLTYDRVEKFCTKHADQGWRILGFWHSHPASPASPSTIDLEQAQGLYGAFARLLVYVIVSLADDEADFTVWRLREDGSAFEALGLRA